MAVRLVCLAECKVGALAPAVRRNGRFDDQTAGPDAAGIFGAAAVFHNGERLDGQLSDLDRLADGHGGSFRCWQAFVYCFTSRRAGGKGCDGGGEENAHHVERTYGGPGKLPSAAEKGGRASCMRRMKWSSRTIATAAVAFCGASASAADFRAHPLLSFEYPALITAEVELADVDGDGDLDVVTANGRHWAQQDYVHLNIGSGRLLEARPLGGLSASYVVRAGDFDGDGDQDLVVVRDTLPALLFRNDGAGGFDAGKELAGSGGAARGARVGDVNGDGHLDVVIARRRDPDLLFFGDGNGGFADAVDLPGTGGASTDMTLTDIDHDGDTDIVVAMRDGDSSLILTNDGRGAFAATPLPGGEGDNRKVAAADFDGDGRVDIALGATTGGIAILKGDGRGGFRSVATIGKASGAVQALVAADLDGDGDVDLVQGAETQPGSVHWNDGSGTFRTEALPMDVADTYGLAVGDVNGDGRVDIVIANSESPNEVLLGRTATESED